MPRLTRHTATDLLAEYDFHIEYRKGAQSRAADYLSRYHAEDKKNTEEEAFPLLHFNAYSPGDVEENLQLVFRSLQGDALEDLNRPERQKTKRAARSFILWNKMLFRRTSKGLKTVPKRSDQVPLLHTFHNAIGYWSAATTLKFISESYW